MEIRSLFDLSHSMAGEYLERFVYPWEALSGLSEWIVGKQRALSEDYEERAPGVFVHRTARVSPSACLLPPCIVGAEAEIRQCAFIRGSAVIGEACVVGSSSDIKNAILFDGAQVPHFNYVGDSILGFRAHMGAGAITSNIKSDRTPIVVRTEQGAIPTGRRKFGAAIGDLAEIGCNAVLNPGSIVGRGSSVYPLTCLRGVIPEGSIVKTDGTVVKRK